MSELKCPKCGEVFTVDESHYLELVNQVRTKEFLKEASKQEETLKKEYDAKLQLNDLLSKQEIEKLKQEIKSLKQEKDSEIKVTKERYETILDGEKDRIELAVNKAVQKEKEVLNKALEENKELESKLILQQTEQELKEKTMKEQYSILIKNKDEMIEYYKDLKSRMSTKMVGETLEQHCSIEFNKIRATAFKNAYFEKDNDAKTGSKGDFIFRDFDDDGTEIVSIMFEMKNEMDETEKKHKNEDFFKELDKDRTEKNCEYAVLVTMLEQDNELYNQGIVDVSYKYDKMYVIRPQFFIPLITMLRNASLKALDYKKQMIEVKNTNIDIENFETNLNLFKDSIGNNYRLAQEKFEKAIDEIDQTIKHLEKVKESLQSSEKNLRIASTKADDVTIKKLTKNSPLLASKFEELKK